MSRPRLAAVLLLLFGFLAGEGLLATQGHAQNAVLPDGSHGYLWVLSLTLHPA